ncbi:MAG TPA: FAD-dependent oxidoreductase [Terracidiphilus sp.]|nr:FAD-dependent oxidoreductase [Terracidiphilus sp.]
MSEGTYDCIIVGGGIVGAACAARFAKEGMHVALVDCLGAGLGATAAGMGHVVVMDDSPAQFLLTQYSQSLWLRLAQVLPPGAEFEQCGTLWVAADGEEMDEVARKHTVYDAHGVPTRILNRDALLALEPELRSNLLGALLVQSDAVVYAPLVAKFLVEEAVAHGARVIDGEIAAIGSGCANFRDGRHLKSSRIVNAAGERAAELTPGLPIKKRKGHLAITDRYSGFLHHQIVELGYLKSAHSISEDSVAFNVQPRVTGQVLIGSSRQFDPSTAIDYAILSRMLARAVHYMPGLADCSIVRTWTGFRAATPDKLPLIGPWPEDESIFLATGHEGLGITTSLATADLLLAHFSGVAPAIPLQPYLPARLSRMAHV